MNNYLAYSPAAITGYLSSIESLSGTNFRKWKEQISIILGVMDLDYALRVDAPAALTAESSIEQKAAYEKWERSNRISLMIMKGSITTAIRGAIPDSDNAKLYLAHIEEQFQGSSKAHATTLITKMVTLKYSGSNGVREHILRMNDMASQLKGLDMEIFEGFLVHFIMTSLPAQFGPFKVNYNTQKEKWKMSELISMCVQEEERLKSEQPDSAHVAITGYPERSKGFRFYCPSHTTRIVETRHAVFFEDAEYSGSCTPRIINLEEIQDHVSIPVIQKVGAPLPHRENNDAPEVVPNDVPPIMDPAPVPANEQPLRSLVYKIFSEEKVESNLARFVLIIWCFVVLILTQSYTASLTSILTFRQLEPTITGMQELIDKEMVVGYPKGSFVYGLLRQFINDGSKLLVYNTTDELHQAFSKGTIAAAFDEIPYMKLFLDKHCLKYTMVAQTLRTAGETEGDKMERIEKAWLGKHGSCPEATSSLSSSSLSLNSFWGLFLIVGVASSLALLISASLRVYEPGDSMDRNSHR
ncbi:hypothetical protein RJ639_036417 [Escallonia herrerae]|uniref:Uncharacterized protein n=1 Tax=Escallonia herrerae TaxID=1293975 RepID=A0AA89B8N4_9ASTE|nr:hypothetical protein RJ639_036417 [Escallonia herrerae]